MNLNHIRHIFRRSGMRLSYLFVFLAIFYCQNSYSQVKNEDDLKKQADLYFENEDYNLAYKLYAQLVSLYPKDAEYNYRLGVCMLFTEPDKKKPYSYLQIATKNPAEAPKDAKFYLAKTYHINYRFDEAIKLYTEYKQTASAASVKKLQVDREIQACKNGKRLLSNLSDLVVITKKQLNEADYFKGYDVKEIGGKLLVKPDEYKSGYDKKKKDKSVVYLPKSGERLYYSSYGDGGNNGRDIYFVNRLPNGSWSKAQILPSSINTEYDEDYPFLHPNGKTLYFSSKGHNSMGGYDVFKTTYNPETQSWSKPVNLEFPINSPDDDILFVTDSLEKTAFFSTGRYSPYGKLDVLKINTERRPMNFAVLKGTVVKENAAQSVKSKITVKNMANGETVGTFGAQDNGDYNMELPNGGKFIFTVETPGIQTQSEGIQVPVAYSLKPYKQVISYENKILKIINYFDGAIADENYSMMIDLIEKKAKLEVNENEPYNNSLLKDPAKNTTASANTSGDNTNLNSVSTTNPTVQSNDGTAKANTNTNKNVTNEQLLSIAKMDAKEAGDEAVKLKKDAEDAFGLATQKTAEAVAKQKEADEAITNANAITDVAKKNEELSKANQLKDEAKIASGVANTATNLAKKLEADANIEQKEADLTNQYISQLEAITKNKNNKDALTKLESIQKELDDLSKQKNQSNELFTSLKAESELKQKELISSEKKSNAIINEINAIKNESTDLEKDLANENDKSIKENISAQIRELTSEIDLKNKELATNNQKIDVLKNEVEGLNQELQIAAKILNEKTDGLAITTDSKNNASQNSTNIKQNTNTSNNDNSTSLQTNNGNTASALSYEGITNKYSEQVNSTAIDKTNKDEVTKQNDILKTYNKEVNDLIALDKNELSKTKDANEKKKLGDEIKQLEKLKAENEKAITSNNTTIKQLESSAIATNTPTKTTSSTDINNTTANNNQNTTDVATQNSNQPTTNNATTQNSNNTSTDIAAQNSNTTSASGDPITSNSTNSSNTNSSAKIATDAGDTKNETQNAIANTTAGDNNAIKTINIASGNDNGAFLNELSNLKNGLNDNSSAATSIFAYNDYKEPTSLSLKQTATQKFDLAKQNEANLNTLITKTENNLKIASNNNAAALVNEAEQLNTKAFEQRKESATKTGADKEALLKQASENEKASTDKKLEASVIQQKQNKAKFDANATNLAELQKLNGQKTSNELSQANMLVDEAALNFKQAQKIRVEAEAYPSGSARLGGLSNAEEKENEALAKQQKSIELLLKANPSYKLKSSDNGLAPADAIAGVNTEINKTAQSQIDAYLALSKANQNELKLQSDKAAKNPAFRSTANKTAQDLKTKSDNLNNEAKAFIGQSLTATLASEKADLLLKANEKEIEAIKALTEANAALINGNIAATTNTPTANPTNTSATNMPVVNSNNQTTATTTTPANTRTVTQNAPETNSIVTNANPNNNTNTTANTENNTNQNAAGSTSISPNNNTNATANSNSLTPTTNTDNNTATIASNNAGEEATKLKTGLNNSNETNLASFNAYTNSDAITLKEKASEKINAALVKDKEISTSLDNIDQLAKTNTSAGILSQQAISSLINDADKLNEDAAAARKSSATKTGSEKEKDLATAKELEASALTKKTEAASKQQQLNSATFNANKQSLEELANLAKGKNIAELSAAEMQTNEAALFYKQATNIRNEANAYPSESAKLGGYSNAEEKESQALAKQQTLLNTYKKYFADYIPKIATVANDNPETVAKLNEAKISLNTNNQQHIDGLLLLTQANEKEYRNRILNLPATLNPTQTSTKIKAQAAYKKQNELLAQANQTTDNTKKKELLIEAGKSGQEAINLLNEIKTPTGIAGNNPTDNNTAINNANNQNNTPTNNSANNVNNSSTQGNTTASNNRTNQNSTSTDNVSNNTNTTNTSADNATSVNNNATNNATPANNRTSTTNANTATPVKIKVEGLEVKTTNAYTAERPIPIDEKIPDGLVFKVQIGAFKAPLPNSTFKGLSPVIAQTTPSGYIRYMAGNFDQYTSANAVKNDLKNLGYTDAFVVAYYNGQRINLNEATDKAKAAGQTIEPLANTSAGLTNNTNIPRNTFTPPNTTANVNDVQPVEINGELEKMNGLLYTVQIGVYSKQVTRSQLSNLKPIYTEQLPNGLYRYTAGIYNQQEKLIQDKRRVVELGVKDAFVSSYYNAKRVPFAEGQKLQAENNNLKMETENPIIFPGSNSGTTLTSTLPTANVVTTSNPPNTQSTNAFTNGVTSGPAPTSDNGVKTDDTGISYKVQIGAYKNQVPNDVASKFLNIKTWPVQNVVINGLYIYTIGNFTGTSFAKKLKDEAILLGITDAYITVYRDGKKLYGSEATEYLSK